jgi:hypothetical protein
VSRPASAATSILLDDPLNVIKAESEAEREKTVRFVRESMSNRLNDERSAIVIIMQRLHENDVSGDILAREARVRCVDDPTYDRRLHVDRCPQLASRRPAAP